jgi:hypothetical protein
VKAFASRDEEEVAGYADVMETVFAHWQTIPLTENHIRQLHRDLLQYSSKDERHRGEYKTLNNHVEAIGPDGESLGVVYRAGWGKSGGSLPDREPVRYAAPDG